jgi:hypothetical protein
MVVVDEDQGRDEPALLIGGGCHDDVSSSSSSSVVVVVWDTAPLGAPVTKPWATFMTDEPHSSHSPPHPIPSNNVLSGRLSFRCPS